MERNEKLYEFVQRIEPLKDSITTEEATKTSMIMPFFSTSRRMTMYPIHSEFAPEFTADVGIKRREKKSTMQLCWDQVPPIRIECRTVQ